MSLPQRAAWAASEDGVGALIGFELLPVLGSNPVTRLAEMIAQVAAELPGEQLARATARIRRDRPI